MPPTRPVMPSLGLLLWSLLLSLGWLLPVHNRPWASFHLDTWIALFTAVISIIVVLRSRGPVACHGVAALTLLLAVLPWLQYFFGIIPLAGSAWMASLYPLGLLLALLTGADWEANSPGQLADGLFGAIGIAAIVSVGLQLYQWFGGEGSWLWVMSGDPLRPFANLGQSNQMGTFLLWGLLAVSWGVLRNKISAMPALLLAAWLLFGLALTGSRTAWIAVVLLVAAAWLWRRRWPQPKFPWAVTGLALYFAVCVAVVILVQHASPTLNDVTRMNGEPRFAAWALFADAAWQRPWFGYGWNQAILAQGSVVLDHPPLSMFFTYSHNLFLDLVLWCGIPLGLLIAALLLRWLWKQFVAVKSAENAVLFLFVLVAANHAMFEYPLYYAYILLPVGLVMGMLNTRSAMPPLVQIPRGAVAMLWLGGAILFTLVVRDYFKVETSYRLLNQEVQENRHPGSEILPDVLLLNQWQDYIKYARFIPKAGMTTAELDQARTLTALNPANISFTFKLAMSLAMNKQPEEAGQWLEKLCRMAQKEHCAAVKREWTKAKKARPELATVAWPETAKN